MSTQTHSLLKRHYCPQHVIDAIVKHAAELCIDLNTVEVKLDNPLAVQIGEPKCGQLIFLMAGMYGKAVRVILTAGDGTFIRELGTYTTEQTNVQPKTDQ